MASVGDGTAAWDPLTTAKQNQIAQLKIRMNVKDATDMPIKIIGLLSEDLSVFDPGSRFQVVFFARRGQKRSLKVPAKSRFDFSAMREVEGNAGVGCSTQTKTVKSGWHLMCARSRHFAGLFKSRKSSTFVKRAMWGNGSF